MIRSEHVKDDALVLSDKVKANTVTIADVATFLLTISKVVLSVRSNQIAIMKKVGVEMQAPRVRTEEKKAE